MGILGWLFGRREPTAADWQADAQRRHMAEGGNCVGWIDAKGRVHDKQCGLTGPESSRRADDLADRGRLPAVATSRGFDHEVSVLRRQLKAKGKHSGKKDKRMSPQARYQALVRQARDL